MRGMRIMNKAYKVWQTNYTTYISTTCAPLLPAHIFVPLTCNKCRLKKKTLIQKRCLSDHVPEEQIVTSGFTGSHWYACAYTSFTISNSSAPLLPHLDIVIYWIMTPGSHSGPLVVAWTNKHLKTIHSSHFQAATSPWNATKKNAIVKVGGKYWLHEQIGFKSFSIVTYSNNSSFKSHSENT